MGTRFYLIAFLVFTLTHVSMVHAKQNSQDMQQVLDRLVSEQRESANLVGLGAIIIHDGRLIGPSVSGERKKGSKVALSGGDQWHIGSVTKPFTATMIARLVEKRKLSWSSTIKDVFGDVDELHKEWHSVTLSQLLTHTSGAAANFPVATRFQYPPEGSKRKAARESAVLSIMENKPENTPGSTFAYSNVGYTIAGVMAEKITGLPWESLIEQEIFTPLQLKSGGFGPPQNTNQTLEQPQGHKKVLGFTIAVGTKADNSPIMSAAGAIHLSLEDLALFAGEHLHGMLGKGILLRSDTFQRLHKPVLNNYAYGWSVTRPKDIDAGTVIWHNGSNTMWYTLLAIMPSYRSVVAVNSNDGDFELAEKSARKIIKNIIKALATSDIE